MLSLIVISTPIFKLKAADESVTDSDVRRNSFWDYSPIIANAGMLGQSFKSAHRLKAARQPARRRWAYCGWQYTSRYDYGYQKEIELYKIPFIVRLVQRIGSLSGYGQAK